MSGFVNSIRYFTDPLTQRENPEDSLKWEGTLKERFVSCLHIPKAIPSGVNEVDHGARTIGRIALSVTALFMAYLVTKEESKLVNAVGELAKGTTKFFAGIGAAILGTLANLCITAATVFAETISKPFSTRKNKEQVEEETENLADSEEVQREVLASNEPVDDDCEELDVALEEVLDGAIQEYSNQDGSI